MHSDGDDADFVYTLDFEDARARELGQHQREREHAHRVIADCAIVRMRVCRHD